MMKKIMLFLVSLSLVPQIVFASTPDQPTYFLYKETFDGSGISQFYRTADKIEHYKFIPIPDAWVKDVSKAKNPLLEAKKRLALSYTQNDANEKLTSLFGGFDLQMLEASWGISPSYKEKFLAQSDLVSTYALEHKNDPPSSDISTNEFQNFTKYIPKEAKLVHSYPFKSTDKVLDSHKRSFVEKMVSADALPWVLGSFTVGILVILASIFLFFTRR